MQSHFEDKNFAQIPNRLLASLARELKNPLILIAREAELERNNNPSQSVSSIQRTAEKTLQLIDSYLLMAQSEYGQKSLQLETVGVGSVIYDVASNLREAISAQDAELDIAVKDANVMTNREGLKAAILCLSELAINGEGDTDSKNKVRIQATKTADKVIVSVLGSGMDITSKDINSAKTMQGISHFALGTKLGDSGIRLAIADILTASLGSSLQAKKKDGLKGLGFELSISKQLQLV